MYFLADVDCSATGLGPIIGFLKTILNLIQIGIPIGLIIIGTVDLGKAVLAGDEKEIKQHQQTLFKRALAAVAVFFVTAIVTFAMGLVGPTGSAWKACWEAKTSAVDTVTNIDRA